MKRLFLTSLLILSLSGCQSTMNKMAGFGVTEVERVTFDNSTRVTMSKSRLYTGETWGTTITWLGAVWSSSNPDVIGLELISVNTYINYEGIKVNIDGEIRAFEASGLTNHYGNYRSVEKSSKYVYIPISYFKLMLSAESVKLRIKTMSGYEDAIFDIGETSLEYYAKHYLANFMDEIKAYK